MPNRPLDRLLGRPQFPDEAPHRNLWPLPARFPRHRRECVAAIKKAAKALQDAFSTGDAAKAALLFTPDAVFEDMALHTRVEGQVANSAVSNARSDAGPLRVRCLARPCRRERPGGGYEWPPRCPQSRSCVAIPRSKLTTTAKSRASLRSTTHFSSQTRYYQSLVQLGAEK